MAEARRNTTIDEQFNAEYPKKGLQSHASSDGRVRKVSVQSSPRNDPRYDDVDPPVDPGEYIEPQSRPTRSRAGGSSKSKTFVKKTNKSVSDKLIARGKVGAINSGATPVLWYTYLFFQLPFAVLNTVFFGLLYVWLAAGGGYYVAKSVVIAAAGIYDPLGVQQLLTRGLFAVGEFVAEGIASVINKVDELTGNNLGEFLAAVHPQTIYMATLAILLAYLIFIILTLALIYMFAGARPFFGRGGGLKCGAIILCFIGYFLPLLNLIPWIFLWTWAVFRYPK